MLVYGEFVPRNALGATLVKWVLGPRSVRKALEQCRHFERYLRGEIDDPFPQLARTGAPPPRTVGMVDRLVRRGVSPEAAELLRRHLAHAPDADVLAMRPFVLADRWALDRRETLALFLHATAESLLEMRWEVLCPNCRIGKAAYPSLRDLAVEAHCETCDIQFDAAFDRSVEIRFGVAPTLRRVEGHEYCLGGPMNTPHVLAQASLGPGESSRLSATLAPGSYRLRSRPMRGRAIVEATDERPVPPASPSRSRPRRSSQPSQPCPAGSLELEVRNATDREQIVLLEGSLWPDTVATAALAGANAGVPGAVRFGGPAARTPASYRESGVHGRGDRSTDRAPTGTVRHRAMSTATAWSGGRSRATAARWSARARRSRRAMGDGRSRPASPMAPAPSPPRSRFGARWATRAGWSRPTSIRR